MLSKLWQDVRVFVAFYALALQEALTVHPRWAVPLVSVAAGFRVENDFTQHHSEHQSGDDSVAVVHRWGARLTIGGGDADSLFHNAALFIRANAPIGVWVQIRFSPRRALQLGLGWKLNGVPSGVLRVQTDASSAQGTNGANVGQASGWADGNR